MRRLIWAFAVYTCPEDTSYHLVAYICVIWPSAWKNLQNGMCALRRLRSAWASAQSDQSILCTHEISLGPYPLSALRRLWSYWAAAQAVLNLRWAHIPVWFWHVLAHITIRVAKAFHEKIWSLNYDRIYVEFTLSIRIGKSMQIVWTQPSFLSEPTLFSFHPAAQQAHIIKMTSYQRRCDVITSHRRWYIIWMLCAHWELFCT